MIRRVLLASGFFMLGASTNAQVSQSKHSCTEQWLAKRQSLPASQRYDARLADAFGRECLGATRRAQIDWPRVRSDLATAITAESTLVSIVPDDISLFCPGYVRSTPAQRSEFWQSLAYEVIKPEAGSNANAIMWEQPYSKQGNPTAGGEYSVGLLQLSLSNRSPYGCEIPNEESLLDPTRNVNCGTKIITYLIAHDNRIGGDTQHGRLGLGRYWSTIREVGVKPARAGKRETRKPIIAALQQLPQCRATF